MSVFHFCSWVLLSGLWGATLYGLKYKKLYKNYILSREYKKIFNPGFYLGATLGAVRYYCDSPVFSCLYKTIFKIERY